MSDEELMALEMQLAIKRIMDLKKDVDILEDVHNDFSEFMDELITLPEIIEHENYLPLVDLNIRFKDENILEQLESIGVGLNKLTDDCDDFISEVIKNKKIN